ncbi:hypothetical protein RT889_001548 [Campylobacter upsaliensis]|nr:hypothetical protein [Campylobacter upsaliensis]
MKREQGKKASQKSKAKFNALCVAAAQGQARSSKVKQGQACGGEQTRLKRHGKFTPSGKANLRQATRQIYAKWQGKFKANSSQI